MSPLGPFRFLRTPRISTPISSGFVPSKTVKAEPRIPGRSSETGIITGGLADLCASAFERLAEFGAAEFAAAGLVVAAGIWAMAEKPREQNRVRGSIACRRRAADFMVSTL